MENPLTCQIQSVPRRENNRLQPIQVGNHTIGTGQPTFIVAEIGVNHNGDMGLARESIDAAAEAGADAVKFQNFRTEEFILDPSLTFTYESDGRSVTESQYDMFKRLELSDDGLRELKEQSDKRGVVFFSTPVSSQGINQLVELNVPLLKNGSDALTHLPLIRAMGRSGLPTVLSTGMADLADIQNAVTAFCETGNNALILLACTSLYPTPPDQANVSRVATLTTAFRLPCGFSDHTQGSAAAVASVCFGSCFIEKHFTVDRGLPGPDHRFSMDPCDLRTLVADIRAAEQAIGDGHIAPTPGEASGPRSEYRFSCFSARPLKAGTILKEEDVAFSRPGDGIAPSLLSAIVGRRLKKDIPAVHKFSFKDF